MQAHGVNGSTAVSKTVSRGSNPLGPANFTSLKIEKVPPPQ